MLRLDRGLSLLTTTLLVVGSLLFVGLGVYLSRGFISDLFGVSVTSVAAVLVIAVSLALASLTILAAVVWRNLRLETPISNRSVVIAQSPNVSEALWIARRMRW